MRVAKEVALYNQGGIQNGLDDASKVATSFITRVSESEGIKVHNAEDLNDYIQVNSNAISMYKDNVEKMQLTDESLRMGDTNNYVLVDTDGMIITQRDVNVASFGIDGQYFNNDYGEEIFAVGRLGATTYTGKANWVAYNGESPFTLELPWDCSGINAIKYYDSGYAEIVSISPTYSLSGRKITFPASSCQTLQLNSVAYIGVQYIAVGRFPYFTMGSDGVGKVGRYSVREGENTVASGDTSHAEGESTIASGGNSHAGGQNAHAIGASSFAHGAYVIAQGDASAVFGKYNVPVSGLFVVGNGYNTQARQNAMVVNGSGDVRIRGELYIQSNYDCVSGGTTLRVLKGKRYITSLPYTFENAEITKDHVVVNWELSNPSAQSGDWTVTTSDGSAVITGSINGPTYVTLYLALAKEPI